MTTLECIFLAGGGEKAPTSDTKDRYANGRAKDAEARKGVKPTRRSAFAANSLAIVF